MANPFGAILAPPLNAPGGQPLVPGVQAGVSTGIFIGRLVIVYTGGVVSGIFFYQGTPELGNPPILAITMNSADLFGNPVSAGCISDTGMPMLVYG